ncbi:MAG: SRPBCC family protein [Microlunatus sp.]|nr:SRPBCC family protein [Microlunatus sp.]
MQLTHRFELPGPVERVFDVFSELDLLAPCFPGASVWGRDGEVYHGAVKIKFGPFPLVFEGTARVVRRHAVKRRLVVTAHARDRRGAAAGAATVTALFSAKGPEVTRVEVVTDLDLTGRPAQLGTGAIQSVSDRLLDQFIGCMSPRVGSATSSDQDVHDRDVDALDGPVDSTRSRRSENAYRPPAPPESTRHLQVLPDVARTWLPRLAGAAAAVVVLVVVARRLRGRTTNTSSAGSQPST